MVVSSDVIRRLLSSDLRVDGLSLDSAVLLLNSAIKKSNEHLFILLENKLNAELLYGACLNHNLKNVVYFPPKNNGAVVPGFSADTDRYRSEVFSVIGGPTPFLIISSSGALKEKIIKKKPPNVLSSLSINLGKDISVQALEKQLIVFGYKKTDTVFEPLTFSVRGEVVDVYTKNHTYPFRILFDYNKIESLAWFNHHDQLSTAPIKKIILRNETGIAEVVDYIALRDMSYRSTKLLASYKNSFFSIGAAPAKNHTLFQFSPFVFSGVGVKKRITEALDAALFYKKSYIVGNKSVHRSLFKKTDKSSWVGGCIKESFVVGDGSIAVFSAHQLYKNYSSVDRWSVSEISSQSTLTMTDLSTMSDGDFIVHKDFGIGLFRGLSLQNNNGAERETLEIEYSNNAKVYVSLEKMDLVHRYLGSAKAPSLSIVGTKKWTNEISKTKKAVELVASELLSLYSMKNLKRSFRYRSDKDLEKSLKSSFPHLETKDQKRAIKETLADLDKKTPMDRLICGDVGFGKTEVAIRAIFKAVLSSKQVAFLCPTTILADQHFITCKERFSSLGVRVSLLSRFKTKKEQKKILQDLAAGKTDVVIGTHRLLSDDVAFLDLSLLIIDEEHRFGVLHKEKIRQLKKGLDVLVLTATPIPRTLQHSLVDLKDISVIQTAPLTRKPINTIIEYFNWDNIFSYIQKEIGRHGQVYFLHNDINSHHYITNKIRSEFPEYKIENIHGQMKNEELEGKILSFFDGNIDVLVCTTIIESGIDVSNANCIIINDAHKFGLSQLYQIRGRVGRGHNKASCFLLVPKKPLEKNAYKRLKTIEQLTSLGSGYEISLKDLEIRGAGSLFGYKQSGHISQVGFEMYCEILKNEINLLSKNKEISVFPDVLFFEPALINQGYIFDSSQRLGFYNRLSLAKTKKEILKIKRELVDRFGSLPLSVKNLIFISTLRVLFKGLPVNKIDINKNGVDLFVDGLLGDLNMENLFNLVLLFSDKHNIKYHYKKQKNDSLVISFISKNTKTSKKIAKDAVSLFSKQKKK